MADERRREHLGSWAALPTHRCIDTTVTGVRWEQDTTHIHTALMGVTGLRVHVSEGSSAHALTDTNLLTRRSSGAHSGGGGR